MIKSEGEWRRFVLRALVLSALVLVASFVGNRLANARDGVAGGAARSSLAVSGTLTGVTGPQTATFRFYRGMTGGEALCAPEVMITDRDETTGAFSVEVPLDQMGRVCPNALFDGSDVYVEVQVGTRVVVQRRAINPVPYAHYASVAGQYGTPDCPVGYARDLTAAPSGAIVCVRRLARDAVRGDTDYVVRVGNGPGAFWVDLYEASVVTAIDGSGDTLFDREGNVGGLPQNGQWWTGTPRPARPPAYAMSRAGAGPARWITWFQAQEACRASGKRLPTGEEWLAAAQGTRDPGANDGTASGNTGCHTQGMSPRTTPDRGTGCQSAWGAQDMIGNVAEWTSEWYSGAGNALSIDFSGVQLTDGGVRPSFVRGVTNSNGPTWPDSTYGGDGAYNVPGYVGSRPGVGGVLPAATVRGGEYTDREQAGIFSLFLGAAPSSWSAAIGFRCMIPR